MIACHQAIDTGKPDLSHIVSCEPIYTFRVFILISFNTLISTSHVSSLEPSLG